MVDGGRDGGHQAPFGGDGQPPVPDPRLGPLTFRPDPLLQEAPDAPRPRARERRWPEASGVDAE